MKQILIFIVYTATFTILGTDQKSISQNSSPKRTLLKELCSYSREIPSASEAHRVFMHAIHIGSAQDVQLLVQHINIHTNNEEALKLAAAKNDPALVALLVKAGADTSVDNYNLLIQAYKQNHLQTLLALCGMPLEQAGKEYNCPALASEKYHTIFVKNFDPRVSDLDRRLLCACVDNNIGVAKDLLAQGANPEVRNDLALKIAAKHFNQDLAALLQTNINERNYTS